MIGLGGGLEIVGRGGGVNQCDKLTQRGVRESKRERRCEGEVKEKS